MTTTDRRALREYGAIPTARAPGRASPGRAGLGNQSSSVAAPGGSDGVRNVGSTKGPQDTEVWTEHEIREGFTSRDRNGNGEVCGKPLQKDRYYPLQNLRDDLPGTGS